MPTMRGFLRGAAVFLLQLTIIGVLTLALLEGIVAFSFRNPKTSLLPGPLLRYLHVQFDRNTIQVMPECARYDDRVTYTLKPGTCRFVNREFDTEYRVNSAGLRDDEASLQRPDVIVLGDSLAMGWGVQQEEAFPALFEKETGYRTLNAGVSSYGTVRALKLLERLDRSALTRLVLQYTDNDFFENEQFVTNGDLKILSQPEYERTVADHQHALAYFPGKYAINVLVQLRNMVRQQVSPDARAQAGQSNDRAREAEIFLAVLERSPVDIRGFKPVVLSLDGGFIAAARQAAAASSVDWIKSLQFVDASGVAAIDGSFYRLDDHPTAIGQQAIAKELIKVVGPRE